MSHRFPKDFWLKLASGKQAAAGTAKKETRNRLLSDAAETCTDVENVLANEALVRDSSRVRSVYVPRHYEEKYAYPLIIWLHAAGGSERDLADVMPQISTRNYVGVGFRGTSPAGTAMPLGFRWSSSDETIDRFLTLLHEQVCDLRRSLHVHSERIYLAGSGEGATCGLTMLLKRPEWFAGAVAIGGHFPKGNSLLARFRHLKGKRVLLASESGPAREVSNYEAAGRLLFAAGVDADVQEFDPRSQTPKILRRVDHWIMQGIATEG